MTVRQANAGDVQSVYEYICDLERTRFEYDVFERCYLDNLSNSNNIYLIAVNEQNKPVGFLSCHGQLLLHHLSMVFEIQELHVEPAYRSQGTGQLLIETLEAILKQSGHHQLELTTNVRRVDAHRFYKKCGFNQTHLKFTKELR